MTTGLTAVIHLGPIEKSPSLPGRITGQQLVMEGLSGLVYVTPEVAAQWIPVLTEIVEESK